MSTQPKAESPEYYWLDIGNEIISLVPEDEDLQVFFRNYLSYRYDLELLTVANFCVTPPAVFVEPTIEQFADGTAVEAYRNLAKAAVFYNLCEEV